MLEIVHMWLKIDVLQLQNDPDISFGRRIFTAILLKWGIIVVADAVD